MKENQFKYLPDTPIRKAKELSPSTKLVLIFIKQHIGANSSSHVSTITLADETGYSRQSVSRSISELEEKGWLIVERRNRRTSIYKLAAEKFRLTTRQDSVKHVDTHVSLRVTTPCKPALQEVYITKKEENQESKAFAGEPAKPSNLFSRKNPGEVVKPPSVKENECKKSNTVPTLEHIWKTSVAGNYPCKKHIPDFTSKQRGQAKHFIQKIKPHHVQDIIPLILTDWSQYGKYVRDCYACPYPPKPSIEFLLKYNSEAINYYLETIERHRKEEAHKARIAHEELRSIEEQARRSEEKARRLQEFKDMNIEVSLDNYYDLYEKGYISHHEWKQWETKKFAKMFAEQDGLPWP